MYAFRVLTRTRVALYNAHAINGLGETVLPVVNKLAATVGGGLSSGVVTSSFATEDKMKPFRIVQSLALVAAIPLLTPSAQSAECTARIRATAKSDQISDKAITKVWAVEVDTQESCAKVNADLVVTERLFDGEVITSTHRGYRKVSNHTSTYKVNYRIAKDSTLTDWKFNVTSCVPCGSE
jgi:hypothetical protein